MFEAPESCRPASRRGLSEKDNKDDDDDDDDDDGDVGGDEYDDLDVDGTSMV